MKQTNTNNEITGSTSPKATPRNMCESKVAATHRIYQL